MDMQFSFMGVNSPLVNVRVHCRLEVNTILLTYSTFIPIHFHFTDVEIGFHVRLDLDDDVTTPNDEWLTAEYLFRKFKRSRVVGTEVVV